MAKEPAGVSQTWGTLPEFRLNCTWTADASLHRFWTEKCCFAKEQPPVPCLPESVYSCPEEFRPVLVVSACKYHTLMATLMSELAICKRTKKRPIFPLALEWFGYYVGLISMARSSSTSTCKDLYNQHYYRLIKTSSLQAVSHTSLYFLCLWQCGRRCSRIQNNCACFLLYKMSP